ncbi:MAG: hypothetical protein AB7S36_12350, partial [Planctomycetota bacterium]
RRPSSVEKLPGHDRSISSTQDIASYLKKEFDADVDEMPADALAGAGPRKQMPPPPPPKVHPDDYIGGTIGLEMPAKTMNNKLPTGTHELLDDEPRIITTPPMAETQWDPETHDAQGTQERTAQGRRPIPEPPQPENTSDFFTKSGLLTPEADEDIEEIE